MSSNTFKHIKFLNGAPAAFLSTSNYFPMAFIEIKVVFFYFLIDFLLIFLIEILIY